MSADAQARARAFDQLRRRYESERANERVRV